jgi:hypothetical protein
MASVCCQVQRAFAPRSAAVLVVPAAPIDAHRRPSEANIAKIGKVLDNAGQENNPITRRIAEFVGSTALFEM